ncbi:hypothetical protein QWZ16_05085 [Vibrio ostreicida]|uniref:Uncharacterized protein n=1 Tax=Vibrio ostreicida TaxID=526588 RepID=A0ABT8BSL1_9VIBR|nr:hypothetical protein [Vibrio ostreicida]MDN3609098.1 hypothetical protein [Vibrio ostreicida]
MDISSVFITWTNLAGIVPVPSSTRKRFTPHSGQFSSVFIVFFLKNASDSW